MSEPIFKHPISPGVRRAMGIVLQAADPRRPKVKAKKAATKGGKRHGQETHTRSAKAR